MHAIKKTATCLLVMTMTLTTIKSQHQYSWPIHVARGKQPCEPPKGYHLKVDTPTHRGYYKLFKARQIFSEAKSACASDGAHLITIRTEEEARIFKHYTGRMCQNRCCRHVKQFQWHVCVSTFRLWILSLLDWSGQPLESQLWGRGPKAVPVRPGLGGVVPVPHKIGGARWFCGVYSLDCKFIFRICKKDSPPLLALHVWCFRMTSRPYPTNDAN